jgi:hypothetical protein
MESETALIEPLGDDVLQIDEGPAADEEDVRRVEGNFGLHRAFEAAKRWHRGDRAFQRLEQRTLDAKPHVLEARYALVDLVDKQDAQLGGTEVTGDCTDQPDLQTLTSGQSSSRGTSSVSIPQTSTSTTIRQALM